MRLDSRLSVTRDQDLVTIALPAEVDLDKRGAILEQALALLVSRPPMLVVDMSETVFCDSSGIDLLIRLNRRAQLLGCELHVIAPHQSVRRVLQMCGMFHVLAIHRGIDEIPRAHQDRFPERGVRLRRDAPRPPVQGQG